MQPWWNLHTSVKARGDFSVKIGELSARTHVSTRLLRYYEEQGLLTPDRLANGYREYRDCHQDDVWQIRGLLASGLPVRIIKEILPCLDEPCDLQAAAVTSEMLASLEQQRALMDERVRCLMESRDAITAYLDAARRRAG
jgi:DNA-binding transcriptional MerR regulator